MIVRDGTSFRGIGVNYHDAYVRTLLNPDDTSYEAGFAELGEKDIPFARIAIMGYWPSWNTIFLEDREEALRRLDGVVQSAERHGVGLVFSVFWATFTVPDLMGEPRNAWGDPTSKTHQFMLDLTEALVQRYRSSDAVWVWEFGNEFMLASDLPNASQHRPPVNQTLGTPAERSPEDDLTVTDILRAYAAFGEAVRALDAHRPISTGDAYPRPHAAGMMRSRGRDWGPIDTRNELREVLTVTTPEPLDLMSIHLYPSHREEDRFKNGHEPTFRILLKEALAAADSAGKALFVGEFGASVGMTESLESDAQVLEVFTDLLYTIIESKVPLAALWNFDGAESTGLRERAWNIPIDGARSRYLRAIADANKTLRRR